MTAVRRTTRAAGSRPRRGAYPSWPAVASGTVNTVARRRRLGLVTLSLWLVYLIAPIRHAAALPSVPARVYTLLVIIVFAVAYIGFFWGLMARSPGFEWLRPNPRLVAGAVTVLVALTLAASVTLHFEVTGFAIYIAALIAFTVPIIVAVPLLVALGLGATVVPQLLTGRPPDYSLLSQVALAAFAVWGTRQLIDRNRQLTLARQQLTELAVAEERLRVGRDVHDILGHSLTVITVKTELAQRLLDVDPERARTEMADVERLAREALAGVRGTVGTLREISLAGELANARTALSAAGIDADLPATDDLPIRHSVVFGWVLREAVTNIVRHSQARHCTVRVTATSIEVTDDGVGMSADANGGSGLAGLRERVRGAGGTLTLSTVGGVGLRVSASFPDVEAEGRTRAKRGRSRRLE